MTWGGRVVPSHRVGPATNLHLSTHPQFLGSCVVRLRSVIDIVTKIGNLKTVSVECYDDISFTFHDTFFSSLLILLLHVNKFNVHDTVTVLPINKQSTLALVVILTPLSIFPHSLGAGKGFSVPDPCKVATARNEKGCHEHAQIGGRQQDPQPLADGVIPLQVRSRLQRGGHVPRSSKLGRGRLVGWVR